MKPLEDIGEDTLRGIRAVLADFDDTLTTGGMFPSASLAALEQLAQAGIACVIVSGRPAGWCDLLARMLPLAAVVGENGALVLSYDRKRRKMETVLARSRQQLAADRKALEQLTEQITAAIPGCAVAADQPWRLADLAIDFAEDVGPLAPADIQRIADMFASAGATAKISSIHVNGWFGDHNKLSTSLAHLPAILGLDPDRNNRAFAYLGDSPNDEPMFGHFENSVGVANVRSFRLNSPPAWVAQQPGAEGFCEFAGMLLQAQRP